MADEITRTLAQVIADSFFGMEAGESPGAGGYTPPTPNAGDMQLAADVVADPRVTVILSTPPADDVREALARRIWDWNVDLERAVLDDAREIADGILAVFEVRPRGTVTDAEVEAALEGFVGGPFDFPESRQHWEPKMRAALEAAWEVSRGVR